MTRLKLGASTMMTFEDSPDQVKIGDLEATSLEGYLKSRDASIRQIAATSQTPAHELIGELVNLSAEALAAAEAGRDRKIADRQTTIGESHEQTLALAGRMAGLDVPDNAQVVWRDTSARSFAATVDGLGKLAQMLNVPPEELWSGSGHVAAGRRPLARAGRIGRRAHEPRQGPRAPGRGGRRRAGGGGLMARTPGGRAHREPRAAPAHADRAGPSGLLELWPAVDTRARRRSTCSTRQRPCSCSRGSATPPASRPRTTRASGSRRASAATPGRRSRPPPAGSRAGAAPRRGRRRDPPGARPG